MNQDHKKQCHCHSQNSNRVTAFISAQLPFTTTLAQLHSAIIDFVLTHHLYLRAKHSAYYHDPIPDIESKKKAQPVESTSYQAFEQISFKFAKN